MYLKEKDSMPYYVLSGEILYVSGNVKSISLDTGTLEHLMLEPRSACPRDKLVYG